MTNRGYNFRVSYDTYLSRGTHAIVRYLFEERAEILSHVKYRSKVLDIGCGTGRMLESIAPYVSFAVGIDISPKQLQVARRKLRRFANVELYECDAIKLPFEDTSFDAATMTMNLLGSVMPHERALMVREAHRVLVYGGHFLVSTWAENAAEKQKEWYQKVGIRKPFNDPFDESFTISTDDKLGHFSSRRFTEQQLRDGFKFFGFDDIQVKRIADFGYVCKAVKQITGHKADN